MRVDGFGLEFDGKHWGSCTLQPLKGPKLIGCAVALDKQIVQHFA